MAGSAEDEILQARLQNTAELKTNVSGLLKNKCSKILVFDYP